MENILKKLDTILYVLLDKYVDIMPLRFIKLIAYYYTDARIRKKYWAKLGVEMGDGTYANLGMKVTSINYSKNSVIIGANVSIAPNVTFITDSAANNGVEINKIQYVRDILTKSSNILIEDDVWIGANVIILPGVTVHKCSVVGAGSLVTRDVEAFSIYVGVPARKIKKIKEEQ